MPLPERAEAAFSEIVVRHAGLVYSAALRQLDSPDLARDVAQGVFTDLARKAPSLADKLSGDASLAGWLYRSTRFAARDLLRGDRRRQARERQVMEHFDATTESSPEWERVRPCLDEAMAELSEEDREAVLLRYFEQQDLHAVGKALGVSEDAAQKRVSRALERLRTGLTSRGVTTTAGALSALLVAETVSFAPAGLAATLSTAALAGTTLATTATATATQAIAMTTLQKTLIAATLVAAVGTGIYEARQASISRTQVQTLQQQQAPLAEQVQQLTKDHDDATRQLAALRDDNERLNRNTAELLRLRGEVNLLRQNQNTKPRARGLPSSPTETTASKESSLEDIGRELGEAVVRGDPTASVKLMELAKSEYASFNTNRVGLSDAQRDELATRTFAPLRAAFGVVTREAVTANPFALNALSEMSQVPELTGLVIQSLGTLAGSGNDAALKILLNPLQHGFPTSSTSSTIGALVPAAGNGNQQAIDALAAVARDTNQRPLWFIAADGLNKAAESGNSVAIDALIGLLGSTNQNVKNAAISGLKSAAANQSDKAAEALRSMGVQ